MKLNFLLIFLLLSIPLADASVKEELEPRIDKLEQDSNLAKYKFFLPLTVKISGENEEFLISLMKEGSIGFVNDAKVDIVIQGKEEDLVNILDADDEEFKKHLNNLNIYGTSFKGKMAVLIAEKITKTKFNKNKTLGDKILGAVIYPLTLLFN